VYYAYRQKGRKAMKTENGKVIPETRACINCDGTGKRKELVPCPNTGRTMRGKGCPHCGSTRKADHRYINTGRVIPCSRCDGTGIVEETLYDTADAIYQGMTFKVYRQDREASWNEQHLGAGCVFSCADYGAAWDHPEKDAALAEKVKASTFQQAIKFCREDGTLADHIGVFVTRGGYSVRAVFTMEETLTRVAGEPDETTARLFGGLLASKGFNGTAFAAGGLA
jgi:hypothetical protein